MTDETPAESAPLEGTAYLLQCARQGDESAKQRLLARYQPILTHWAHGRLPGEARGMIETSDLVQVTLWRAFQKMGDFEQRQEGGFFAYLRRTLVNLLRDELRRARARPQGEVLQMDLPDFSPSPLEEAVGREALEAYEDALSKLPPRVQEAVILRVEWGLGHAEVADALGLPSANAARMAVSRALARLAEVLDERDSRSQ